ncbi:MAG: hypothetical protein AAFO07_19095, partial [Bacteroidota bacterium]
MADQNIRSLSRQKARSIIIKFLDQIKEESLLEHKTGLTYTQLNLAGFIGLKRTQDISNAKSGSENISDKRLYDLLELLVSSFEELKIEGNEEDKYIHELAFKLANNLIDISTQPGEKFNRSKIFELKDLKYKPKEWSLYKRERFIAIVGAGASHSATKNSTKPIPIAKGAVSILRQAFNHKVQQKIIDDEIKRLANIRQTSIDDFETQLMALARFSSPLLIKKLEEFCGNRNTPTLVYDILAHMFKHRFVDVIINF